MFAPDAIEEAVNIDLSRRLREQYDLLTFWHLALIEAGIPNEAAAIVSGLSTPEALSIVAEAREDERQAA